MLYPLSYVGVGRAFYLKRRLGAPVLAVVGKGQGDLREGLPGGVARQNDPTPAAL